MIVVNVNAGLGNQMFHYAFGLGLIHKGYDIYFDQVNFKPRKEYSHETILLQDAFPNILIKQMPDGYFKYVFPHKTTNRIKVLWLGMKRRLTALLNNETYIFERTYAFDSNIEDFITSKCIFRGHWQTEKYFSHCAEDVRKQFTFLPFDEERNLVTVKRMTSENSVAIHFRKSEDYIQNELMGKGLCGTDYYMRAIDYIRAHVDNPVFYVFTDNPQWVKENLPVLKYTLVDWNEVSGKRNFRDMQLMACAKHNIIANSTYSWWGAWLNPNPNKIVIGPAQFFNPINEFFSKSDIMCEGWIAL